MRQALKIHSSFPRNFYQPGHPSDDDVVMCLMGNFDSAAAERRYDALLVNHEVQ